MTTITEIKLDKSFAKEVMFFALFGGICSHDDLYLHCNFCHWRCHRQRV